MPDIALQMQQCNTEVNPIREGTYGRPKRRGDWNL